MSARAADRSCSVPVAPTSHSSTSPSSADYAGVRSILLASKDTHPDNGSKNFAAASSTADETGAPSRGGRKKTGDGNGNGNGNGIGGSDGEGAGEGRAWDAGMGREDGRHGGHGGGGDDDYEEGDGCVTLAITTCKRLRAFLGTAEGLQVRVCQISTQISYFAVGAGADFLAGILRQEVVRPAENAVS